MAIFSTSIPIILEVEGQYSNNENDYGGETKYGISKKQYPNLDIKNLTQSDAMIIIQRDFWRPNRLNEILSQDIANKCLILIMNMNPIHAIKIIQHSIILCSRSIINVVEDGIIGSDTIEKINSLNPFYLINNITIEACKYYISLTDSDNSQIPNFRGWIRRALL